IEMAIYQMPGGQQLVQPRLLAQSEIVRRIVVHVDGVATVQEDQPEDEDDWEDPELVKQRTMYREFWTEFLSKLRLDDQSQPLQPPTQSTNQYFKAPTGSNAWVCAFLAQSQNRCGVYLNLGKGALADRLYAGLAEQKPEIDSALGLAVEWKPEGGKHQVVAS